MGSWTGMFYPEMIAARRLIVRLRVTHLYGVMTTAGRRPLPPPRPGSPG
jgi:hypothetical protein